MSPVLYVFAGPNGSGKSTIIKDYISFYGLGDIEYICPDTYASMLFPDIDDVLERYKKAMDFAAYKRERLLNEHKSMIVETVLSRSDKIDFVRKAKDAGYRIISVFVGTSGPEINISRVRKRVTEGGHDVPEDKLRNRFFHSMKNLPSLAACSDELYIYDNSGNHPVLAISVFGDEIIVSADAPEWTRNVLKG